ncbi:MAG: hypothetical protein ACRC10_06975 [Thermoguttaceae bacterium]
MTCFTFTGSQGIPGKPIAILSSLLGPLNENFDRAVWNESSFFQHEY